MQNSPSQVSSCTGASCRMVRGISRIAVKISSAWLPDAAVFGLLLVEGVAGRRADIPCVVMIVHSTAPKNAAAPI